MVGTDIALEAAVVVSLQDIQNAGVAVAVAVGSFREVTVVKVLDITDVGESDAVAVLADDVGNIVVGVGVQRAGAQGQAVAGMVNHLQETLDVLAYDVAYEVTDETGTHFTYGDIRLPEGKIPFIMSQDDVNYYGYMIGDVDPEYIRPASPHPEGDGFAHKLVIGEDGYPTCEYMDAQGNITTGDYDLVPILEKFIQEHPDFSYHGARAVLGMTGYEGVFGYRTKPSYEQELGSEAFRKEIEQAKEVAQCLRDHGWILASHSYGHPSYGEISAEKVAADVQKWEDTVESVIGKCDIILYPNGSDVAGTNKYTMDNEKFKAMYDSGLRYFFNVDSNVYWSQLGDTYYRGGRRNLDGYRMYNHPHLLDDLFPVEEVFDKARPTPISF